MPAAVLDGGPGEVTGPRGNTGLPRLTSRDLEPRVRVGLV
ncbi:hypothetical protein EV567_5391 [Streptomyces sp. BK239]|nr:hypothetical protein EV567_5391 [Streptomyces sp. BK239]